MSLADALAAVLAAREKHAQISTDPKTFFVHVRVPEHVVERLRDAQRQVLPDVATHAEIDHVTLVYTVKPGEDHPPERVHAALGSLRALGEKTEPINAKVQGWGYFDGASKDGKPSTAVVALVDAPGLEHLHVDIARVLEPHGIEPSDRHVFTPHITLGYLPQHGRAAGTLPPVDATFAIDAVHVAARDLHEIPLTGRAEALGQKAAAFALPRAPLLGAGVGAGIGALGSAVDFATDTSAEREASPLLKRMLVNGGMGALGGGIVGATHHMAQTPSHAAAAVDSAMDQFRFASLGERAARMAKP